MQLLQLFSPSVIGAFFLGLVSGVITVAVGALFVIYSVSNKEMN